MIDVDYDKEAIIGALKAITSQPRPSGSGVYGGGDAGEKIAEVLNKVPLRFHKTITY